MEEWKNCKQLIGNGCICLPDELQIYNIFVNCNWVVTRWQQYSTYLHTNNTQYNTNNNRTTQITTNFEECGPCPVFASFITLAFALHLRKKHGKPSVRVRKTSVRVQQKYYQNTHTYTHTHISKPTHKHTSTHYKII